MNPERYLQIIVVLLFLILVSLVALDVILYQGFESVIPDVLDKADEMNRNMEQIAENQG